MSEIKIEENYEVSWSPELHELITQLSIKIGDDLQTMGPFERFYALKILCEEIESRCMLYTGVLDMQKKTPA